MNKQAELYQSIVDDIRKKYNGRLSEPELHEATRNFIEFWRIIIETQFELEKEKNSKT